MFCTSWNSCSLRVVANSPVVSFRVKCILFCFVIEFVSSGDYYDILQVPRNAGEDQIRRAYKKLAMKYHPVSKPSLTTQSTKDCLMLQDKVQGSEEEKQKASEKFQQIGTGMD